MAEIIPSNQHGINRAAMIIKQGGLIAMPTETVYGLAGNAYDDDAIRLIYQTKNRPAHNPLIVHIAEANDAYQLADIKTGSMADRLIQQYWYHDNPDNKGALTLVLNAKANSRLSKMLITRKKSIALRCPHHPIAKQLITASNVPVAAPSANISGALSPTRAIHVLQNFLDNSQPELILDDATSCQFGLESTIIDARYQHLTILRHGSLHVPETNMKAEMEQETKNIIAPGMLSAHYQPKSRLRLNATMPENDELMLGFGIYDGDLNLSKTSDLAEAAYHFYDYLHQLDAISVHKKIAVAPIPDKDIGVALNDRLRRASYTEQ
ncbi:MAG: threonylcarbamoyl-AMP synthase [Alphaproteobacteria bacterium]|nr:threonylcarbamoyl-AMP synthase [Alphaproteobacteria bacterium]